MDITIAPLIDIVFLLLIFFMLITRFLNPAINVDMPVSGTAEQLDTLGLIIVITDTGDIYIDDKMVSVDQLEPTIKSKIDQTQIDSVRIRSDKAAEVQMLIEVLDVLRRMNISDVAIETKLDDSK